MKILVANLGSTSLKYRLFSMEDGSETLLAKGGFERVTDHGAAIDKCLENLKEEGHLVSGDDLDAVGFKTILGKNLTGCVPADDQTLEALEAFNDIAPSHNPAYANGIRQFRAKLNKVKLVALFETAFYQWVPAAATRYAVPEAWHEAGVRRNGFHGASHKFIAERSAELLSRDDIAERCRNLYLHGPTPFEGQPLRVISCHLGGSSSIAGCRNGVAVDGSFGMSPQSGLPHNNRVGDLDASATPFIMKALNLSIDEVQEQLVRESGLLGLSGVSNDLRDIREKAAAGNTQAQLAIDVLIHCIRHWIGAFFVQLNGCDALVFTGGIGENNPFIREAVCANLDNLGIEINPDLNNATLAEENLISSEQSRVKVFVIPANEELVVARETCRLIAS